MAASIQAGAQVMRLLRWPAERLDTLGGYLTYHNVMLFVLFLFVLFLSLYAGCRAPAPSARRRPRARSRRSWRPDGHVRW